MDVRTGWLYRVPSDIVIRSLLPARSLVLFICGASSLARAHDSATFASLRSPCYLSSRTQKFTRMGDSSRLNAQIGWPHTYPYPPPTLPPRTLLKHQRGSSPHPSICPPPTIDSLAPKIHPFTTPLEEPVIGTDGFGEAGPFPTCCPRSR